MSKTLAAGLLQRAKAGLSNPNEISEALAQQAMNEALELIGTKSISAPEAMDLGYFRLLLLMGMEFSDSESNRYDKLLGRIDKAAIVVADADADGSSKVQTQKALVVPGENVYA